MKNKIIEFINKTKNKIEKNTKNVRWEVRYNNLEKKYNEMIEQVAELKKQLDNDKNANIIKEKNKYIKMLKTQRDNLRRDYEELSKCKKNY